MSDFDFMDTVTGAFKTDGEYDMSKIVGAGAGAAQLFGLFGDSSSSSSRPSGYQGGS